MRELFGRDKRAGASVWFRFEHVWYTARSGWYENLLG